MKSIKSHCVKTLAEIDMPKLLYGTAWKKEKTTQLVIEAILSGFKGIDTACQPKHYREDLVGEALFKLDKEYGIKRDSLFIQTKFTSLDGQAPMNIPYDKDASLKEQVQQSLDMSLSNLKTDYIDSLVLHSPMRTYSDTLVVWKMFEEFVKLGKVKQIGISNIYKLELLTKIWEAASIKPAVIQNRFYPDTNYDFEIRKFCNENGIFYQSFWTLTANPDLVNSKVVKSMAVKKSLTNEQVFFKLLSQIGIIILTGTTNKKHMEQDLQILEIKDFSNEEIQNLSSIFNGLLITNL